MEQYREQYCRLRDEIIARQFGNLNPVQRDAVFTLRGPVLILAGAGSGKTTVVVNRIANMILYGEAYGSSYVPEGLTQQDLDFLAHCDVRDSANTAALSQLLGYHRVRPWNILAITFTNKAANELKERLERTLGPDALDINAGTFHSACVRMLRRDIACMGYPQSFTIYDTDDSVRVIKDALKTLGIDDKLFPPKALLNIISRQKDRMVTPEQIPTDGEYRMEVIKKVYEYYQKTLKAAGALDFDDIIMVTVQMLETHPEVLEYYQKRFQYIMVDEYQDTNHAQYRLVSLLSQSHHNICVVGDDDQSIYKFRGAMIENILSFEQQFPNTKVVRLEQNYRCTKTILEAANRVIENNTERKGKELWTNNEQGEKICHFKGRNALAEARFVAETVLEDVKNGQKYSDHAVLYRQNALSREIEQYFVKAGIPYKIIGGVRFYERKEIKDMTAYLSVIANPQDTVRLKRIINEPKRAIGDATVEAIDQVAAGLGLSAFEVMEHADEYAALAKKAPALKEFCGMIKRFGEYLESMSLDELFDEVLDETGYREMLEKQGFEGQTRLENVAELKSQIIQYSEQAETPSLQEFLEEVALYADTDGIDQNADCVLMMTMHSAKGLEFPVVFLVGAEEGIFPSSLSMNDPSEIEEERRLCYVAITRAKQRLYITSTYERMLYAKTMRNRVSRFVEEIPMPMKDVRDEIIRQAFAKPEKAPQKPHVDTFSKRFMGGFDQYKNKPNANANTYQVGDVVVHQTFGKGRVVSVRAMGNDHLLEIVFDTAGQKKIMANFAKLEKA